MFLIFPFSSNNHGGIPPLYTFPSPGFNSGTLIVFKSFILKMKFCKKKKN